MLFIFFPNLYLLLLSFNYQTTLPDFSPSFSVMAWQWGKDDDKLFETALVLFPENIPNRFQAIADHLQIPVEEVMYYYDALVHDIELIESDRFPITDYPDYSETGQTSSQSTYIEKQRQRGVSWSQEEHKLVQRLLN